MSENALQKRENATLTRPAESTNTNDVTLTPRVDIVETDEELLLYVDLPGVLPQDVDIRFEQGELTLCGRRAPQTMNRPWLWEYEPGGFHRVFRVTEQIAADKITAEMKDGVMTVHLPKVEAAKPRRIAVKAG
jgi:HSP20 family protein